MNYHKLKQIIVLSAASRLKYVIFTLAINRGSNMGFAITNVANMFFPIPIREQKQEQLAFQQ